MKFMISIFVVLFSNFVCFSLCEPIVHWTTPTLLNEENTSTYAFVSSVYYDPITQISHILYADYKFQYYDHYALLDQGKVLYKTRFDNGYGLVGLLRGPKDGKHIALAYWTFINSLHTFNFTESFDNGLTWKKSVRLVESEKHLILQDMIYIKETGRIFIFYEDQSKKEIRMITRSPGSEIFSNEIEIGYDVFPRDSFNSKFDYNFIDGKTILHMFYKNDKMLLSYSNSYNNGITWSDPKIVTHDDNVTMIANVVSDSKITKKIIVSYIPASHMEPPKMVISENFGETFGEPIPITFGGRYGEYEFYETFGLKLFGSKENPVLCSFYLTKENVPVFAIWNLDTGERNEYENPFYEPWITTLGLDLIYNSDEHKLFISALVTRQTNMKTQLLYSHGEKFIEIERAKLK